MAVSKSAANAGRKTHETKPSSKLAKSAYVTKPENRHPQTHGYSVGSAESQIRKMGGGK
jgi:hypothetical protein